MNSNRLSRFALLTILLCLLLFGVSHATLPGTWETKNPMPAAFNGSGGVIDGHMHVVGGSSHAAYDPSSDGWAVKAAPLFNHGGITASAVIDNKLYIVGGCLNGDCGTVTGVLEMYDPSTNSWTQKAPMPTPRGKLAAVAIAGKLYVVGGMSAGFASQFATLEVYDPMTNTWDTTRAPMPTPREGMRAANINRTLYVVGGFLRPAFVNTGVLEVYDPMTNTWDTTKAPMPTAREAFGVGVLNASLHAVGGNGDLGSEDAHEVYDPAVDSWTTDAPMLTPRSFLGTEVIGSRLYAAGGFSCVPGGACGFLDVLEVFTPGEEPPECVPPPIGMVGWWPGDGNADDIVGGNDGALQNGAAYATGKVSQAFLLDGVDDFVNVGNAAELSPAAGDFSVDAWVSFSSYVLYDRAILHKMTGTPGGTPNENGWMLIKQDDHHFWFSLGGGLGNNGAGNGHPNTVRSTTAAVPDTWFHVAAVKSSSAISIYVNGVLEDTKSLPPFLDTNSVDLLIGGGTQFPLNGLVDEVEVFNRALSASEILAIFNAGAAGKCKSPTVLSPEQATESLVNNVNALVSQGTLNQGQGNALTSKLDAALKKMDQGNGNAARNQLQAFINQVNALMNSGSLSAAQGQALIDAAINIIAHIP